MNAWTPSLADPEGLPPPSGDGAVEVQLGMLARLAEAGLNIVIQLERQAKACAGSAAPPAEPSLADLALAYARASRAVRMTIALQSRLMGEQRDRARGARLHAAPERQARIERVVGRIAQIEHEDDEETVERLVDEAAERLEDGDVYGDVLNRPVSEVVADICRDLGLSPDWAALAQEGWAREELDSGSVGAPLAAFTPGRGCPDLPSPLHRLRPRERQSPGP